MLCKKLPLVSIVIPCYNHEAFVQESIQSVIDQTYKNIELIIIDDGSKDSSIVKIEEMLEQCRDRFTRFEFRHRPNIGLSATLNEALEWCQGEYYAAIASDDIILPKKTEIQVKFLNKHKKVVAVFGGIQVIDGNNQVIRTKLGENKSYPFNKIIMHKFDLAALTQMIRLESIKNIGGYNDNMLIEDWYMWLKLSEIGKVYHINTLLASYRVHDNNFSKDFSKMHEGRVEVLSYFKHSKCYKKALANVNWINAINNYKSDDNNKSKNLLKMFYFSPLVTTQFILITPLVTTKFILITNVKKLKNILFKT